MIRNLIVFGILGALFVTNVQAGLQSKAFSKDEIRAEIATAKQALFELQELYESAEKVVVKNETAYKVAATSKTLAKYAGFVELGLLAVTGLTYPAYFLVDYLDWPMKGILDKVFEARAPVVLALIPTSALYLLSSGARKLLEKRVVITEEEREELLNRIQDTVNYLVELDRLLLEA